MSNWGPEEHYQYWKDATIVANRPVGVFNLVVERKPGRPQDCSFAFAQCSIMRGPRRIGSVALQYKDGEIVAWGVFSSNKKTYLLRKAVLSEHADSNELIDVATRLIVPEGGFPEGWDIEISDFPFGS